MKWPTRKEDKTVSELIPANKQSQLQPISESASLLQAIVSASSDENVDVEKMERLWAMKEKIDAKEAEMQFNIAMTVAQTAMRPISADATNPQTHSKYASYAKLDGALRPIYSDAGFALSFDTGDTPKELHVRVLCYLSHKSGHSRTHHIDMPADGKGAKGGDVMTKTHATGAGVSYGMRYLLKMIFNVAVGEDDRDGNDIAPQNNSQNRTAAQSPRPDYPDNLFNANYPAWVELVRGGKPHANIINKLSTTYTLTDEQKKKIMEIK